MLNVSATNAPSKFFCNPEPNWTQGFATYGGYVAAAAYRAARLDGHRRPLLSAQINFLAPAPEHGFHIEICELRVGKGTSVIEASVLTNASKNQKIVSKIIFTMGLPRESRLNVYKELGRPEFFELQRLRDQVPDAPQTTGIIPVFMQHFQLRTLINGIPFSNEASTDHVWAFRSKFDLNELDLGELALLFSDISPPPQLMMMPTPSPASSASWMITLEQQEITFSKDDWFYVFMALDTARNGYGSHSTALLDKNGQLFSSNRQITTSFEKNLGSSRIKKVASQLSFQARLGLS